MRHPERPDWMPQRWSLRYAEDGTTVEVCTGYHEKHEPCSWRMIGSLADEQSFRAEAIAREYDEDVVRSLLLWAVEHWPHHAGLNVYEAVKREIGTLTHELASLLTELGRVADPRLEGIGGDSIDILRAAVENPRREWIGRARPLTDEEAHAIVTAYLRGKR